MKFIKSIIERFKYRYDHTQCVIKKFSIYASKKSDIVEFKGRSVLLNPGKYTITCKTPFGYRIKTISIIRPTNLHIKTFILK